MQAPAGEIRNRLTITVDQMDKQKPPATLVTQLRAVSLLEEIAMKDGQDLLDRLAHGAESARLTIEARAALERLKSKAQPNKRGN